MDSGTGSRPMRTSSLRTRLLLAVGALALAAVVAVALAARQGTREEFLRFQELEQHSNTPSTGELARRLANQLDGRCCADGPVREAAAQLSSELALVITTVEKGRLVTSAGAALDGVESLTTHRDGDVLTLDAVQRRSRLLDRVGL